ncbi:MAG: aldehyde oxidase, partial [bacterium]
MKPVNKMTVVNKSVRKIDALALSQGKPMFTGDRAPAGALQIKMLWSPHAHAKIKSIDVTAAEKMPGVKCVLYHGNVPRIPHCTAGQGYPEPSPYDTVMFDNKVRFVGDRVAAVAAETAEQAAAALKAIKVEYELLQPVFDYDEAIREGAPVIHDEEDSFVPIPVPYEPKRNVVAKVGMESGDFEKAMKEADFTFDDTFKTPYAQHCPAEGYISWA